MGFGQQSVVIVSSGGNPAGPAFHSYVTEFFRRAENRALREQGAAVGQKPADDHRRQRLQVVEATLATSWATSRSTRPEPTCCSGSSASATSPEESVVVLTFDGKGVASCGTS